MNQQNLDYLKDNLKYMGFGDKLNQQLEKNIQQGFPEFVLKQETEYGKLKLESNLHFRKSDQTDLYFFNRHDASLKHPTDNTRDQQQSFYVNKGHGVTLKEAYNLLDGRAVYKELVNKEGEKYQAWMQLDFNQKDPNGNNKIKQYHENYGFDLKAQLQQFPIKELGDEQQKQRLEMAMQKGNLQAVTLVKEGKEERLFIEANPQYKTLNVYDANLKSLSREQKTELTVKPEPQQAAKQDVGLKKKEDSLLPKKRTSQKNGLSIS